MRLSSPRSRRPGKRVIDLEQRATLPSIEPLVLADRGPHAGRLVLLRGIWYSGLLIERVGRDVEIARDLREHLLGGLAETTLDLRHVGVRDADHARELPHRELRQLALTADDLPERRGLVGHETVLTSGARALR
jgi:hypothetical protein